MNTTTYYEGGYDPAAPAQNRSEQYDSTAGTYTRWDADGAAIEQRPLSQQEVAVFAAQDAEAEREANRTAIDAGISTALTKLDTLIAAPALADVPTGTLTTAQLSNIVRALRDAGQANRAGAQDVARVLKQTIRLVRGDFDDID